MGDRQRLLPVALGRVEVRADHVHEAYALVDADRPDVTHAYRYRMTWWRCEGALADVLAQHTDMDRIALMELVDETGATHRVGTHYRDEAIYTPTHTPDR